MVVLCSCSTKGVRWVAVLTDDTTAPQGTFTVTDELVGGESKWCRHPHDKQGTEVKLSANRTWLAESSRGGSRNGRPAKKSYLVSFTSSNTIGKEWQLPLRMCHPASGALDEILCFKGGD